MTLIPENEQHQLQIAAGTLGRNRGHQFEKDLAEAITASEWSRSGLSHPISHRVVGNPAIEIIRYIAKDLSLSLINSVQAWWLGGLATSGLGDILHTPSGSPITRSKSDVLIAIHSNDKVFVKGISVKTCGKNKPTNGQLYFTTASAFAQLLRRNDIPFSDQAEIALKMFCGDKGFRPRDMINLSDRLSDPDRWFFEELSQEGRKDLEFSFSRYQAQITRVLLQLAYAEDPHPPEYLMHLTIKPLNIDRADLALFSIEELISQSCRYAGFHVKEYIIRKGRFKTDRSIHLAPRFGYIQFQRGGQKQHPTQLQFNLQAGYFNRLSSDL